jgi:hypothetical protein
MTGLLIRLHRDHGGIEFIRRLYDEIPKRTPLKERSDRQGARDNFYESASYAANQDLFDFFTEELRWEISADRHLAVQKSIRKAAKTSPTSAKATK